jgi:hypothetical protein
LVALPVATASVKYKYSSYMMQAISSWCSSVSIIRAIPVTPKVKPPVAVEIEIGLIWCVGKVELGVSDCDGEAPWMKNRPQLKHHIYIYGLGMDMEPTPVCGVSAIDSPYLSLSGKIMLLVMGIFVLILTWIYVGATLGLLVSLKRNNSFLIGADWLCCKALKLLGLELFEYAQLSEPHQDLLSLRFWIVNPSPMFSSWNLFCRNIMLGGPSHVGDQPRPKK